MKLVFSLLLLFIVFTASGRDNKTYYKLYELNKCWSEQPDISQLQYPIYEGRSESDWIRTHLQLVEQTLRAKKTGHLSAVQRTNREAALDHLNLYWHAGNFPVNDQYSYRTPIFIDKYDNFCAVGYLVKATGHEQVSRMIAAKTNLAYVKQMNYPELQRWAKEYGFTTDELAWIQPGYPPTSYVRNIGGGTDGEVNKMYTAKDGSRLYVGGAFVKADNTIAANNIAYITESNGTYTWHSMGDGLNGSVNAIIEFDNKLYAAGDFTMSGATPVSSIAYWDGSKWNAAGCINGKVKDLTVFNNELYAVGDFDVCAAMSEVNFAKWNGTVWMQVNMVEGHINTVHNTGAELILGGKFSYAGDELNVIAWNPAMGLIKYGNAVQNEVNDIEILYGQLYLVTAGDKDSSQLAMMLNSTSNQWLGLYQVNFSTSTEKLGIKTLFNYSNALLAGGDLYYKTQILPGTSSSNCAIISSNNYLSSYDGIWLDSTINTMEVFKGVLMIGGKFNLGYTGPFSEPVHSIARNVSATAISDVKVQEVEIYPNPASGSITVKNNFGATDYTLYDASGKTISNGSLTGSADNIQLQHDAVGNCILEVRDKDGNKVVRKVVVE